MAEVERMACDPAPLAERPARIAALEREIEELSHVEEALVDAAIARGEPPSTDPRQRCRRRCSASGSQKRASRAA
jgi:hypothetical protein